MFWIEEYTEMSSGLLSLIQDGRPQTAADSLSVPSLPQIHTHLVITSHTRAAPAVSFNPHQSRVSPAPAPIAALSGRGREACEIPPTLKCSDQTDQSARLPVKANILLSGHRTCREDQSAIERAALFWSGSRLFKFGRESGGFYF